MSGLWFGVLLGVLVGAPTGALALALVTSGGTVDDTAEIVQSTPATPRRPDPGVVAESSRWRRCRACGRWTDRGRWCSTDCHRAEDGDHG